MTCWHLLLLCRDVAKAGGKLSEGWTVRLGNKQPAGYFKDKVYKEAGTGGAQEQQGACMHAAYASRLMALSQSVSASTKHAAC